MRRIRALVVVLAATALTAGLAAVTPAIASSATPGAGMSARQHSTTVAHRKSCGCHAVTGSEFKQFILSHQIGPGSNTYGGVMTFTSMTYDHTDKHGNRVYNITKKVSANPARTGDRSMTTTQINRRYALGERSMKRGNWWDPTSWDWGGILGGLWDAVQACASGGVDAGLGSVATTGAMKILGYGSSVAKVNPDGYLLIVVAGCIGGVISND